MRVTARQVVGELFITAGVIVLLFAFYEAYWTNIASGRLQDEAREGLEAQWSSPQAHRPPSHGEAFAKLHIPAFGDDYHYVILEGTSNDVLAAGPGHYVKTQLPGEPGNFAIAGHRIGKGAPFTDLGQLNACDDIIVETADRRLTYRVLPMEGADRGRDTHCLPQASRTRVASGDYAHVYGRHITLPHDTGVLDPLPGHATDAEGLEPLLTLTTCHPQFSNTERMIIHAMLIDATPKHKGTPH